MDGFTPTALGILYAEDFSETRPKPSPPPPPPPVKPALTQADIDAACIRAVQSAQLAWTESAAERKAEALATVAAQLREVAQQDLQAAEALADGVARAALSMVAGALPDLCRNHGDAEARALVRHLAPLLCGRTRLVIRAHPGLIELLSDDLERIDEGLTASIELRPANLPPGDVRLAWENGSAVRDTGAICASVRETLAQLGLDLTPTTPATQTGSLALAQ